MKILRGLNGEIQWLATNTRPDLAAGVSISAGTVNKAEIGDLQHANKLVKTAKADSDIPLIFNPIPIDNIRFISFSDSSWANRSDGSSQGGQLHMMADKAILEGKQSWTSVIDCKSWKLRRVTRDSLAGEVQAFSDCQDTQEWLRTFWQERWSPNGIQLKQSGDSLYSDHASTILTDCKSLYDALAKIETSGLQLTERRAAIDATGCKVRLGQTNCNVRWVNSDRQLADGLTKPDACDNLRRFQRQ